MYFKKAFWGSMAARVVVWAFAAICLLLSGLTPDRLLAKLVGTTNWLPLIRAAFVLLAIFCVYFVLKKDKPDTLTWWQYARNKIEMIDPSHIIIVGLFGSAAFLLLTAAGYLWLLNKPTPTPITPPIYEKAAKLNELMNCLPQLKSARPLIDEKLGAFQSALKADTTQPNFEVFQHRSRQNVLAAVRMFVEACPRVQVELPIGPDILTVAAQADEQIRLMQEKIDGLISEIRREKFEPQSIR